MIAQGKYVEALQLILRTLPLPGVIGRICPHPCEDACRRGEVDSSVSICALKRFVADRVDLDQLPIPEIRKRSERIAIIGSGPAGLSSAYFLALDGYQVTIFEALPVAGGMLRVGIPDYRLPPTVLDREIGLITRLGVEMIFNTALGKDFTLDDLFAQGFAAIYLAIGAHRSQGLNIPGEDAAGVIPGVQFLRCANLGELSGIKGRVIIVGGGDVAIDTARVALRLGAAKVSILYRRTRHEMPARTREIEDALAEGIDIQYLTAPSRVFTKDGIVTGLQCLRMELGVPDESGRKRPVPVPGSDFTIEADLIIPAIGQTPDSSFLAEHEELSLNRNGTLETDPVTFATNREGVFAGGDAQTGPWIAISAVAQGKEAALSISRYLKGEDQAAGRQPAAASQEHFSPLPDNLQLQPRAEMSTISMARRRSGFEEVELGLTEAQARAEALKCLNCMGCSECLQCVSACKAGAITPETHAKQQTTLSFDVGSVVLAPGFQVFDPRRYDTYGYKVYPNVVTSMEFERILSASGPYQGHLVRPSDHGEPQKIAWLQCVGSRNINQSAHPYCSSICCMVAVKEALIAGEHASKGLEAAIFFMDLRSCGKDFERYAMRAKETGGVRFIRSRVHSVEEVPGTHDLLIHYVSEDGQPQSETFDMMVLSVGMEIAGDIRETAGRLGLALDENGFVETKAFNPVETSRRGVYACGVFTSPKDIPETVTEASAAACAATQSLSLVRDTRTVKRPTPAARDVSREPPKIGVFICNCGTNIGGVVRVPEVARYAGSLPQVVHVEENLFTCSQDTQDRIAQVIQERRLNRVVIAACSPRTHESLFQETLVNAGLNKFLMEMANIRNHDSWVHSDDSSVATQKAKDLVRMAVAKSALLIPLHETTLPVNPSALVVGGGVAGLTAALSVARQGYAVHLVERAEILGGNANRLHKTYRGEMVSNFLKGLVADVNAEQRITVYTNATVSIVQGFVGNFRTEIQTESSPRTIEHGVAILATGAREYPPAEYLYGEHPAVLTHLEMDERLAGADPKIEHLTEAAFIQCVGSRDRTHPYCSRVCCTHSIRNALELLKRNPNANVTILYRDMRTYGKREELFQEARSKGVLFFRYASDEKPEVTPLGERVRIEFKDHILGRKVALHVDLLCLATAIIPRRDRTVAQRFKVPTDADGWFLEAHQKLRPVDFANDGIYLCGMAHYPKSIEESIAQAQAAAARATTVLARGVVSAGGMVTHIRPELCSGCQTCINVCPYGAVSFNKEKRVAEINEATCKGCGACAATCPSEAPVLMGFDNRQLNAQIRSALAV